jgi:hypothetical protein
MNYTGTATELLCEFILHSANACLLRIEGGKPARVFFTSALGGPECSLPITEISRHEVQHELRRVAVVPIAEGQ